jgi:hypothetical protein
MCTDAVRAIPLFFLGTDSGLAVRPPNKDDNEEGGGGERDSLFRNAQSASAQDSGQVKRTITMVRTYVIVYCLLLTWLVGCRLLFRVGRTDSHRIYSSNASIIIFSTAMALR